ncbi:hypothetical protein C8R47DRAFT_1324652 [Mycena vitilis]|nr:hypothetical protein C8R47DRAFT_1324652 [Mycena vitilis]
MSTFIDTKTSASLTLTGYLPETDAAGKEKWPRGEEKVWKEAMRDVDTDVSSITKSFVNHVQTSLARQPFNLDDLGAYQAAALSVRDNLLVNWNETSLEYTRKAPKRAYYLSLETSTLKASASSASAWRTSSTRSATPRWATAGSVAWLRATLDSSASQELPVWGYGLRYKYGIFQQLISPEGNQPRPMAGQPEPVGAPRLDVSYEVRFYGQADRLNDGTPRAVWTGGQEVLAMAYDVMIPGCDTKTTNNLRLWESKPKRGFDLNSFNAGNYEGAVEASNSAAAISVRSHHLYFPSL